MILVLASILAVFLAGSVCGIFAVLVIGIHVDERRVMRGRAESSRAATASRRMLSTRTCDDTPDRVSVGR
ncbi:hypothetical protein D0T12_26025 [Actinomadura spongiicola]|uniref:Uncharacterized protein n=1 Tax=Actinomadura spongiicola TaxID=2303421 RepID=A0A372GBV4_9ACTN|nr:hypothetical protein [Actinomadura spongiicola]RFS82874.1 hypothetical protein D0T12_26025 [Actinomadura spongiicola]